MKAPAAVIPARYASRRLPGKPLLDIAGRPLILRVVDRARAAGCFDPVLVATDDPRIAEVVRADGARAELTSPDCPSGTDRIAEVARKLDNDVIVNVQGDEPLVDPKLLARLATLLVDDPSLGMATVAAPFPGDESPDNPNRVKVVVDEAGDALYFSRSRIPYHRDRPDVVPYRLHLGLYAYRRELLLQLVEWPVHPLEEAEQLEQLRALAHGVRIRVITTERAHRGVDTPEDLAAVRRIFAPK